MMFLWVTRHPYLATFIATFIFKNIINVMVSSLPAPTKDSSAKYVYWFKVSNAIIGNLARAGSTALENSPNWQAALDQHLSKIASSDAIQQIVTAAIAAKN